TKLVKIPIKKTTNIIIIAISVEYLYFSISPLAIKYEDVHGNNTPKSSLARATLPRTTVAVAIIGVTKFLSQSVINTKGDIVKYNKKAPRKYSLIDCIIT